MIIASLLVHIAFGALLALIFMLYYVNGDGKWKLCFEILIGAGGNAGLIFALDSLFNIADITVRMYSIAGCIFSFLITTVILLIFFSYVIKDKDDKDIIRLRDIMLGQTSWINKYYERRAKEIDSKLNILLLEEREKEIEKQEERIRVSKEYIDSELGKIEEIGNKKLKLVLPEKANITLTKEYIEVMPSYINDICRCINDISSCTKLLLNKSADEINITVLKSYFISIATYILSDIFGGTTTDVRVHFRMYDAEINGYKKLVAVIGNKPVSREMTVIPYEEDNMINKSYGCKRALIKSVNVEHDFRGNNYTVWQDYMTYAFYNLQYQGKPFLSFGISVKNAVRYKKILHFLNYFKLETFLQDNVEQVDEYVGISNVLYGGLCNEEN